MRTELIMRYEYGSVVPWVRKTPAGLQAIAGPDSLYLATPVELRGVDLHTVGEFTVEAGQRSSVYADVGPSHRRFQPTVVRPTTNCSGPKNGGASGPTAAPIKDRGAKPSSDR